MTVGEALDRAQLHFFLRPGRELSAKSWDRLPQEVRDKLAQATSEEIGKVRLWRPER